MTHEQHRSAAPEPDSTDLPAFEAAYQAAQKGLTEGGIPLVRDGRIMGAIGVSTGTIEQDQEVALAGAGAY